MPNSKLTQMTAKFASAFDPVALEKLGRETLFLQRIRAITPMNLIPCLMAALGSGRVTTLTELWSRFNLLSGVTVEYKALYDRLANPGFPRMMDKFVERLMSELLLRSLRFLPGSPFARFKRILAQDGSSLAVSDALAEVFPGRFNKVSPAAVELHMTYDLCHEAPVITYLTPDTQSERDALPEPATIKGDLLLADRGYPSYAYCASVRDEGGFFLMRAKSDGNPDVIGAFSNGCLQDIAEPMPLKDFIAAHPGRSLDLQIQPTSGAHGVFRLLLIKTPKGFTRLLTNLPFSDFSADAVGACYRLRWQIELIFKEWKSYANLHRFDTANEEITEGLIWASIATALTKRFLARAAQIVGKVAVSTLKAVKQLPTLLVDLVAALLGGCERLREAFAHTISALMRDAKRSNTKRERQTGRQQIQLRPIYGV